jgi:hypothetical protein
MKTDIAEMTEAVLHYHQVPTNLKSSLEHATYQRETVREAVDKSIRPH